MKRVNNFWVAVLFAALVVAASPARSAAQTRKDSRRESPHHRGEAKITMKEARATALAQVPGGRIKSSELEKEKGQLIYSFDIRTRDAVKEVHVDALTGKVLEVTDESPSNEAKERRKERHENKQHLQ